MSYWEQIQAALWGKPVSGEEYLQTHLQQGTGALVFPCRQTMTPQMKMVCVQNMQQQVRLQHTLEQAWTALTQAGIRPVLMKGASLAALYPSPERRAWGDIDLFVGKDQYHPSCAVMRQTFPKALKFDEELDHYKHYNLIADGISIEIHRVSVSLQHPLDERRYAKMEDFGVKHASELEIGNLRLEVFEPTFNALFVFLHALEHLMTKGANVRQLCDLALLLHHDAAAIDRRRLQAWLKALRLADIWQVYMYVLVKALGLTMEEAPGYTDKVEERGERLMEALLRNGERVTVSGERKIAANRFVRKWHTMQERMGETKKMNAFSPALARHLRWTILLHGISRLFAKDRKWE